MNRLLAITAGLVIAASVALAQTDGARLQLTR